MKPNAAIAHCRDILNASGSNFAFAFRMLPEDQRDVLTAFYAFCRLVDDTVDEAPDPPAQTVSPPAPIPRTVMRKALLPPPGTLS